MPYQPYEDSAAITDGVFRWRLGVRPLDLADWFEFGVDADGPEGWIAEKREISARDHDTVFAVLDDIEIESTEVAHAVVSHLRTYELGASPPQLDASLHPLDAAARLVPEDLVLMVMRGGRMVFGGGSVCFPNRWDLRSKLGSTIAEVHEPVAGLNHQLGHRIDHFLDRLTPDRSFWRLGWGIIDTPDGFTPPRADQRPDAATTLGRTLDGAPLHLRVERETLRRFPRTNCVLFTIRTYIEPLDDIVPGSDSAKALAAAIEAMPDDIRSYKGLIANAAAIVDDLRAEPFQS